MGIQGLHRPVQEAKSRRGASIREVSRNESVPALVVTLTCLPSNRILVPVAVEVDDFARREIGIGIPVEVSPQPVGPGLPRVEGRALEGDVEVCGERTP